MDFNSYHYKKKIEKLEGTSKQENIVVMDTYKQEVLMDMFVDKYNDEIEDQLVIKSIIDYKYKVEAKSFNQKLFYAYLALVVLPFSIQFLYSDNGSYLTFICFIISMLGCVIFGLIEYS